MERERFDKFTLLIDGISKSVQSLKNKIAPKLGIKGVHVLWIYELSMNADGLTAAELAEKSRMNRSLISRESEFLLNEGYVSVRGGRGKNKTYNATLMLTDKGLELAERVRGEILAIQDTVSADISAEELANLYITLSKLQRNFDTLAKNIN